MFTFFAYAVLVLSSGSGVSSVSPQYEKTNLLYSGDSLRKSIDVFKFLLSQKKIEPAGHMKLAFFQAAQAKIPSSTSRGKALKFIKDIFKEEYSSRNPQDRKNLAEQLLKQSADTPELPTKYVLLTEAIEISNSIGDPDTAFGAISALSKSFLVDELKLQIDTLNELSKKAKSPEAIKYILSKVDTLTRKTVDANRFEEASRLIGLGLAASRKVRDTNATSRLTSQKRDLALLRKQYDGAARALETLKANPSDEEANLVVGQYIGYFKNDIEKALPYLARSSDEELSKLSLLDLEQPTTPTKQIALGDAWFEFGITQKQPAKATILSRAGHWYSTAKPKLSSLMKIQLEKKIAKINKEGGNAFGNVTAIAMSKPWSVKWGNGDAFPKVVFEANGKVTGNKYIDGQLWKVLADGSIQFDTTHGYTNIWRFVLSGKGVSVICKSYDHEGSLVNEGTAK